MKISYEMKTKYEMKISFEMRVLYEFENQHWMKLEVLHELNRAQYEMRILDEKSFWYQMKLLKRRHEMKGEVDFCQDVGSLNEKLMKAKLMIEQLKNDQRRMSQKYGQIKQMR